MGSISAFVIMSSHRAAMMCSLFALSAFSGLAEELRGAASTVQMEEVTYKGPSKEDWAGLTQKEQEDADTKWQKDHIKSGPRGPEWMPIVAVGVMIMFPAFCLVAMWRAKPDPKDRDAGCEGWGPCLLFGGLTLALWIYLSIVGAGWVKFMAD